MYKRTPGHGSQEVHLVHVVHTCHQARKCVIAEVEVMILGSSGVTTDVNVAEAMFK